uniref:Uncharacterized protein n=1 Tax=Oryza punctata TaxID=4537 RepID=A0A0E0K3K3_ORYPU
MRDMLFGCFLLMKSELLSDGVRRRLATMTCFAVSSKEFWCWPCEGNGSLVAWLIDVLRLGSAVAAEP